MHPKKGEGVFEDGDGDGDGDKNGIERGRSRFLINRFVLRSVEEDPPPM